MFCPRCGKKVEEKETVCPSCMCSINKPYTIKYCKKCGRRVEGETGVCACGNILDPKKKGIVGETEPTIMKYCPRCGERMNSRETICPVCFCSLKKPNVIKYCEACGNPVNSEMSVCAHCGRIIDVEKKGEKRESNTEKKRDYSPSVVSAVVTEEHSGVNRERYIICPRCGKKVSEESERCSYCGYEFRSANPIYSENAGHSTAELNPQELEAF